MMRYVATTTFRFLCLHLVPGQDSQSEFAGLFPQLESGSEFDLLCHRALATASCMV